MINLQGLFPEKLVLDYSLLSGFSAYFDLETPSPQYVALEYLEGGTTFYTTEKNYFIYRKLRKLLKTETSSIETAFA